MVRKLLIISSSIAATACLILWVFALWWTGIYIIQEPAERGTQIVTALGFQCGRAHAAVWPEFPFPQARKSGWSLARTGLCPEWPLRYGGGFGRRLGVLWLPLWLPLAFFSLYPALAFIRGPLRSSRRRRAGLCRRCAYNLTGNLSGICPECGQKIH